jgi:cold shock CspA family protein
MESKVDVLEGRVCYVNQSRGFFFIDTPDGDLFGHISSVRDRLTLTEDDIVTYTIGERNGKKVAVNIIKTR